ncbi:MAG: recombinase RecA [Pseudomonadota bacterium]|nr:recombinase RecA [Pseudomonadota bacterium]
MMIVNDNNRQAALAATLIAIEKQHGKGSVMRLDGPSEPVAVTPTGSLGLDLALGCGGYPRGRIIEIYGPEASGKTTLTLHAMAQMQAAGGTTAFIDAEHALDPQYAAALGVRLSDLILSQPDNGEQALDIVELLVRSGTIDMVVIDSVAALVPRDELEGNMGDMQVGLQARMMSKAMRKLTNVVSKSNTTLIFINQIRQKIGMTFGPSEVTTGGNALKYYASVRLDVRRIGAVKKGEDSVGNRTRVKVVKNKLAPPFRQVEFDILFGRGVNRSGEIFDMAEAQGSITRSGSWYAFGETKLGQGRDKVIEHLETNPSVLNQLERALSPARVNWAVTAEA